MAFIFNGQNGCRDDAVKFVHQVIFLEFVPSIEVGLLETEKRRVLLRKESGWRQEDGMCPVGWGGFDQGRDGEGGSGERV